MGRQQVVLRKKVATNEGQSKKLLPKYSGPYTITKILDHDRYVIEDLSGTRRTRKAYTGVCSSDKLKPFPATYDYSTEIDTDDSNEENNNECDVTNVDKRVQKQGTNVVLK
ncbi:hypothetical protein NQ314_008659 [Rhamnusium bicolor]|uniref:Uncharacterized protein n=1 Tax=Rhamnusium bicolor TaxID=1586634 RepID=A0AAV8Y6Y3_9CUCU|nr:hypothetical protein NQ314_008659 [Rhamnusium bicolor]